MNFSLHRSNFAQASPSMENPYDVGLRYISQRPDLALRSAESIIEIRDLPVAFGIVTADDMSPPPTYTSDSAHSINSSAAYTHLLRSAEEAHRRPISADSFADLNALPGFELIGAAHLHPVLVQETGETHLHPVLVQEPAIGETHLHPVLVQEPVVYQTPTVNKKVHTVESLQDLYSVPALAPVESNPNVVELRNSDYAYYPSTYATYGSQAPVYHYAPGAPVAQYSQAPHVAQYSQAPHVAHYVQTASAAPAAQVVPAQHVYAVPTTAQYPALTSSSYCYLDSDGHYKDFIVAPSVAEVAVVPTAVATTVAPTNSINPYVHVARYQVAPEAQLVTSSPAVSYVDSYVDTEVDRARIPDVFVLQHHPAGYFPTPMPPALQTLNKRAMGSQSELDISRLGVGFEPKLYVNNESLNTARSPFYELEELPRIQSTDVIRDYSKQSLEDLRLIPSISSYKVVVPAQMNYFPQATVPKQ